MHLDGSYGDVESGSIIGLLDVDSHCRHSAMDGVGRIKGINFIEYVVDVLRIEGI
jgi:hypothetical protein